jgi:hypothetical protein
MIWVWILIAVILTVVSVFAFYNFYWLSRPQVFLVYRDIIKNPEEKLTEFNPTLEEFIEAQTGAKIATEEQIKQSVGEGLNVCKNGFLLKGDGSDKNAYMLGYPINVPNSDGQSSTCKNGTVKGCGCNKVFNEAGFGTGVRGYWMYGTKPARPSKELSDKGWMFSDYTEGFNGAKQIENKYQIFGIPKLI